MTEFSAAFHDRPNILGSVKEVVDNVFGRIEEPVTRKYETPQHLKKEMSKAFNIKIGRDGEIKEGKRLRIAAVQYFCYQSKMVFKNKFSLNTVGEIIGNYHHTTVLHSIQTCKDRLETRDCVMVELHEKWIKYNLEK